MIRRQAGSVKNRAEERRERRRGGDDARPVAEGPGGKTKEEQRPKDLCSVLPGQLSQQQETLSWQAASTARTAHTHMESGVKRVPEYQGRRADAHIWL